VRLTGDVKGNKYGTQRIYLRSDEKAANYIAVAFKNNH
jgi:hypothetical protein